MTKLIKIALTISGLIFLPVLLFFFWASSPTLDEKQYVQLINQDIQQTVSTDSVYSIITYNIGYLSGMTNNLPIAKPRNLFDTNLKTVLYELKKSDPEFIALQEIDYDADRSYNINQQHELASLGYDHIAQAINWDKTYVPFPYWPPSMHFGKVVSGQSILSKYPITIHKSIVLERVEDTPFYRDAFYLDRLLQVAEINVQGRKVVIMNVHLEAWDRPTRDKQTVEIISVYKEYSKNYPTILLGDFNSDPSDPDASIHAVLAIPNIGYVNSKSGSTFPSDNPSIRIDHIFYTAYSIEAMEAKVLTEFGTASDHLPVAFRFRLK